MPFSISLAMTGLISVSSSTRSPMTIAPPCAGLNAVEPQGGPNGDAVERHREVAARKAVAVNVAGYRGTPSNRFIDFLPVDLLGIGSTANRRHSTNRKHVNSTHDDILLNELHCPVL